MRDAHTEREREEEEETNNDKNERKATFSHPTIGETCREAMAKQPVNRVATTHEHHRT